MTDRRAEALPHYPEWCEQPADGETHDDTCPDAPFQQTKRGFVVAAVGGAEAAITSYLWMLNEEHETHEQALEQALSEAEEAAVCHVGIGSCGRGWCDHG